MIGAGSTEIPPLVHLAAMITFVALVVSFGPKIRTWWRNGCPACLLEDSGGASWTPTPHTCFSWRNPYRDRRGNVYEFGKIVRPAE